MNQPAHPHQSMNQFPLPEGTVLVPGDYYGMKLPEYAGDPVMFQPYSMIQFDVPEGYVCVRALTESTYEQVHHVPEVAGEMGRVNGLMPMATEKIDSDAQQRPTRSPGLGTPASRPQVNVTDSSQESIGAQGLMNPAAAQAAQTPQAPAQEAVPAPSGGESGSDTVPSTGDLAQELAGNAPPPPPKATGKKAPAK